MAIKGNNKHRQLINVNNVILVYMLSIYLNKNSSIIQTYINNSYFISYGYQIYYTGNNGLVYNAHVLLPRVFLFKLNTEIMKLILFAFCFLFGKNSYGESFTKLLEDNRQYRFLFEISFIK